MAHLASHRSVAEIIFLENVWRQNIARLCRTRVAAVFWRILPVEIIRHILCMAFPLDVVRDVRDV